MKDEVSFNDFTFVLDSEEVDDHGRFILHVTLKDNTELILFKFLNKHYKYTVVKKILQHIRDHVYGDFTMYEDQIERLCASFIADDRLDLISFKDPPYSTIALLPPEKYK